MYFLLWYASQVLLVVCVCLYVYVGLEYSSVERICSRMATADSLHWQCLCIVVGL